MKPVHARARIRPAILLASAGWMIAMAGQLSGQVEFGRDVLPILRQNCIGCHGPSLQSGGLRLDRRSSVIGSEGQRVVPGVSTNSRVYRRLAGTELGPQMPPSGPLRAEQIAAIRRWIDDGAAWPDALANEVELPPVEAKAMELIGLLRAGRQQAFLKAVTAEPALLNVRGPGGGTPFMFAALYASAPAIEKSIKLGANVNARNDGNATALLWAARDLEKTRVLLNHGADANARSDYLRTPLMAAARRPGGVETVRLLLDRGANPNPNKDPGTESSPLTEAATAGDAAAMELLISRGADVKAAGQPALAMAILNRCAKCRDLLLAKGMDGAAYSGALAETAVLIDIESARKLVERGADVNVYDPLGRTPLMYAAGSDLLPVEFARTLIEHGADVNARDRHLHSIDEGQTPLEIARARGNTPMVELLLKSGAKAAEAEPSKPPPPPDPSASAQHAVTRGLPAIQAGDAGFTPKSGCVSCHNNSLAQMAVAAARKTGFPVNEAIAAQQVKTNLGHIERYREKLWQGFMFPVEDVFGVDLLGYVLIALGGENHKSDLNTDAVAMYILDRQSADGHWEIGKTDFRPPLGSEYVGQTVLALRSLQLYAPPAQKAEAGQAVRRAAAWLAKVQPDLYDDLAWQVLGLAWAGSEKAALDRAVRQLKAVQHPDGGWSDIASLPSNPYATGKALVALQAAGAQGGHGERGVQFLLKTQLADGSWYVKSRSLAFQPYFDAGFPHGFDQWISAAGTSWATMALAQSMPQSATSRLRAR